MNTRNPYRRGDMLAGIIFPLVLAACLLAAGCAVFTGEDTPPTTRPTSQPTSQPNEPSAQQQAEIDAAQGVVGVLIPPPYNELAVLLVGVFGREIAIATRRRRAKAKAGT